MNISSTLTLELFNQPFLLEKRIELLYAIEKTGSISKATKEVPMSYKTAWEAVDSMNNLSHTPILTKATGGAGGGGTQLTAYGKNLLKTYTLLKEEHSKFLQRLQERTDIDTGTFNDIGRLGLQISARNQIQGIIKEIHRRKVNTEIVLKLKSGHELRSIITNSAVEFLNLQVENEVMGIFKASSVFMCKEARYGNVFLGKIKQIFLGDERMELILDIGEEETVVSVMSLDIIDATSFEIGDRAYALIQAYDVMIGR